MASIMEPMMGTRPMAWPSFRLPFLASVAWPKASMGPAWARRPKANSSMTPELPTSRTMMK